jgi:hypothetical protein
MVWQLVCTFIFVVVILSLQVNCVLVVLAMLSPLITDIRRATTMH